MIKKEREKIVLLLQNKIEHEKKIMNYLSAKGYKTISASSELEALSLLSYKRIDVVISDVELCMQNSRQNTLCLKPNNLINENSQALDVAA